MSWELLLVRIAHKIDQTIIQSDLGFIKQQYAYKRNLIIEL
jgi:hypothetical protein